MTRRSRSQTSLVDATRLDSLLGACSAARGAISVPARELRQLILEIRHRRDSVVHQLHRTGKRIAFLSVPIGGPFFKHDSMWVRTTYDAATKLTYSGRHESTCNFVIDPWDAYVEFVDYGVSNLAVYEGLEDLRPEDDPTDTSHAAYRAKDEIDV